MPLLFPLILGTVSGTFLATIFYFIEDETNILLYTLLLNVDFVPYFYTNPLPEWGDYLLHLVVSLGICYQLVFTKIKFPHYYTMSIIGLFVFTLFLYPLLSSLSIKTVPEPFAIIPFTLWTVGHLLYFYVVHFFISNQKETPSAM